MRLKHGRNRQCIQGAHGVKLAPVHLHGVAAVACGERIGSDQVTGSVGFLRKPFDREQLKAAICKLISNGNSSDGVGENHDQ